MDMLPCGCEPSADVHLGNCLMRSLEAGKTQHPAIIKLYEELNEIWYTRHGIKDKPMPIAKRTSTISDRRPHRADK